MTGSKMGVILTGMIFSTGCLKKSENKDTSRHEENKVDENTQPISYDSSFELAKGKRPTPTPSPSPTPTPYTSTSPTPSATVSYSDLTLSLLAASSSLPGATQYHPIMILNNGPQTAYNVSLSIRISHAISASISGVACTPDGQTQSVQCDTTISGISSGYQKSLGLNVTAHNSSATMTINAVVSSSNIDSNATDNSHVANVIVSDMPSSVNFVHPQEIQVLQCAGSSPLVWANCVPSSIIANTWHLRADRTVDLGENNISYSGSWSNPSLNSIELSITNISTGLIEATYSGTMSAASCFEGTVAYPQNTSPWFSAFRMCNKP